MTLRRASKDCAGVSMSTIGFFALAKDPPESRANYTHPNHISGAMVELPEDMGQLSWSIEENLSFQKASLMCGLPQVCCKSVFPYRSVPLPEPMRLTETTVAMGAYTITAQTTTAGTSSPTSQAAPSSPVAPAVEVFRTCIAEFKEDLSPGEGSRFHLFYCGQGCTQCLH